MVSAVYVWRVMKVESALSAASAMVSAGSPAAMTVSGIIGRTVLSFLSMAFTVAAVSSCIGADGTATESGSTGRGMAPMERAHRSTVAMIYE